MPHVSIEYLSAQDDKFTLASARHGTYSHLILLPLVLRPKLAILSLATRRDLPLALPSLALQPRLPLVRLIRLPRQTPLRNPDILANILDQGVPTHVIVFRPYEAQYHERQVRTIKVLREIRQDVDLDAARGVLVVRVVPDAQHGGVDGGTAAGGR